MKYSIVEKENFKVIGIMETVQINNKGSFITNYNELNKKQILDKLEQLLNTKINNILYGTINKTDQIVESFIGIETDANCPKCPKSLVEFEIPKQKWAVFELVSFAPQVINNIWSELCSYWFPVNGYELASNVELYQEKTEHNRYELWIPVKKLATRDICEFIQINNQ